MKYFIQVYNDKCFSRAAKNLFISQQGLSKTIKKLEDELKVPLLERTARGVKPTDYGDILFEKSNKLVNEYEKMMDYLYNITKVKKGTISIGLTNILHTDFFTTFYNFQEEFPEIKFELVELGSYACEKYLEENLIDISFSIRPDNTSTYDFIPISVYEMMVLVNKQNPLCKKEKIRFHDLENEKFIMFSPEYKIRKLTIDSCMQCGFYPNIVVTTSQLDFIVSLVDSNIGIAVLPVLNSLKVAKMSTYTQVLLFDQTPFSIELGFLLNKNNQLNYLTDALVNYASKIIENRV